MNQPGALGPDQASSLIGSVFAETYRIDRLIGQGGMGLVFAASHVRLSRRYAIKLLKPVAETGNEAFVRFQREAEVTSGIGHPHILEVFDFNVTPDGTPYIVMELLEGEDLATRIQRQGRLEFDRAATIFSQAASALQAAHERGVVHRDLKPANLFLCARAGKELFVKVVDFGLSKIAGSRLTGSHDLLGSPCFMAPEQALKRPGEIDDRTDVYGMATIVYTMLVGHPPFTGSEIATVLRQVIDQPPPSLRASCPQLPTAIDEVVLRALRKRPEERYPSMGAFWEAFDAARGGSARVTMVSASDASQPPAASAGLRVGNYVLGRKLGEGGMGVVYQAEHPEIGRQVAVKLLASRLLQVEDAVERFVAEARAVARLKHPNIIPIFDFGRLDDGRLYYVMDYIEGRELLDVISERGRMTAAEVLPLLQQIGAALQAAHDAGIVHRDLKPENIFVPDDPALGLQVLDFGIAKLLEPGQSTSKTATGMVMGSPQTMAPEQAAGTPDRIGPHTDVYSLGVVLYWMLAGEPPFDANAAALLMAKHITEPPPPLASRAPAVPAAVAAIVERCLGKEPADRPPVGALVEAFAEAVVAAGDGAHASSGAFTGAHRPAAPATTLGESVGEISDVARLSHAPSRLKWIGLAAAVTCALLVMMLTLSGGDRRAPPAAARVASEQVELRLTISPPSAKVFLDGELRTERRLRLPASDRSVELRVEATGYRAHSQRIVPRSDQQITIALRRLARRPRTAADAAQARPPDAGARAAPTVIQKRSAPRRKAPDKSALPFDDLGDNTAPRNKKRKRSKRLPFGDL